MAYITPEDLAPFAEIDQVKATAMIEDALAEAYAVAPCLSDESKLTDAQKAYVKSILRQALLRWNEAGTVGTKRSVQDTAGAFMHGETVEVRGSSGIFWPSEIKKLSDLCESLSETDPSVERGRAFVIDTIYTGYGNHSVWCHTVWGWPCSCGANLTAGRGPLWEVP